MNGEDVEEMDLQILTFVAAFVDRLFIVFIIKCCLLRTKNRKNGLTEMCSSIAARDFDLRCVFGKFTFELVVLHRIGR